MQIMKTGFRIFVGDSPFGSVLRILQWSQQRGTKKNVLPTLHSILKIRKLSSTAMTLVLTSHDAKRPMKMFNGKINLATKSRNWTT
jgi:hypothetical protein